MKQLDNLLTALKEFKHRSRDLKRRYDSVSSILIFPTIKKLIEELRDFERNKYLDHIHGRNYQKLFLQLNHYIREIKTYTRQLEVFIKSTHDYITDKYNTKLPVTEKTGSHLNAISLSKYFSFDDILTVYDIFLNVNYENTPVLLFQNILNEKLKRKRARIADLNSEITEKLAERNTKQFIEFLRKYDPYNKRLQIEKAVKSTREVSRILMKRELAFTDRSPKDHLINLINQKTHEMKNNSNRCICKKDLLIYFEFTGYVLELLDMEKRENLQKICNEEFYIIKAKKFITILFEDCKEENDRLIRGLDRLKQDNVELRVSIEGFKKSFMASLIH